MNYMGFGKDSVIKRSVSDDGTGVSHDQESQKNENKTDFFHSPDYAVEFCGIHKWFGPVHANDDISFAIPKNTIHGIVGENGAGKSTLMDILIGYYTRDEGEIYIHGKKSTMKTPQDAINLGIGMVHQHFMLVENFTVLENILLGSSKTSTLSDDKKVAREKLMRIEREYGLQVDLDAVIEDLPVGLQQRVEILKALYQDADILVLDEPSAVLTPSEVDDLFRILRLLKSQGKTILLITHKLREIMDLTDNVSVMRRGKHIATIPTATTSKRDLAEKMVGRLVNLKVQKEPPRVRDVLLSTCDLSIESEHGSVLDNININIKAGEIVGIAGISGNGQTELLEVLTGVRNFDKGSMRIKNDHIGSKHHLDAANFRDMGVGHVPEDRIRMGMVKEFAAYENCILGHHSSKEYKKGPLHSKQSMIGTCNRWIDQYDVRPTDPSLKSGSFSGGNQQKLVIAREIEHNPDVLIVGQPTRGVDIGAIEFIHKQLVALRDKGKAILVVSVELDEILNLSDRLYVMYSGRIMGEMKRSDADETTIGMMMAGTAHSDLIEDVA